MKSSCCKFQIGLAAVVFLVLLRFGNGWLFFYEGLSKHNDPNFSAAGYLSQAKGPFAEWARSKVPDPMGRQRLAIESPHQEGEYQASHERVAKQWEEYLVQLEDKLEALHYEETGRQAPEGKEEKASGEKQEPSPKQKAGEAKEKADATAEVDEASAAGEEQDNGSDETAEDESSDAKAGADSESEAADEGDDAADESASENGGDEDAGAAEEKNGEAAEVEAAEGDRTEKADEDNVDSDTQTSGSKKSEVKEGAEAASDADDDAKEAGDEDSKQADADGAESGEAGEEYTGYKLTEEQLNRAEIIQENYAWKLQSYIDEHREEINQYLDEAQRYEKSLRAEDHSDAWFQQQRDWEERRRLKSTARPWLDHIEGLSRDYQADLNSILTEKQREAGPPDAKLLPVNDEKIERINFLVTYGTIAIGVCLMLGLFSRVACLAGAGFLLSVILMQPPWPSIYPPSPPAAGNALIINKEAIAMLSLLALAMIPGRWGGLDFFIWSLFRNCCGRTNKTSPEASAEDKK